jgi:hypothetical protein
VDGVFFLHPAQQRINIPHKTDIPGVRYFFVRYFVVVHMAATGFKKTSELKIVKNAECLMQNAEYKMPVWKHMKPY